ncbi:MAG: hypothetical protein J5800_05300 [Spirochaetales bacterium]|nr:hypothetical protein [Spirochaetales bacterium]
MTNKKAEQPNLVSVSVRRSTLDDKGLENLVSIVKSKESLIQKAFATGPLRIEATKDKITFHWFVAERPEDMNAYSVFIEKLCSMAKTLKRVNAKEEKIYDNEKYAFRCFLLRLGLIGDQYKETRKVLLRNLSGSAAFKSGAKKQEVSE